MTDFADLSLMEVSALNTEQALNYFWAHIDEGYFKDRAGFYAEVLAYLRHDVGGRAFFSLCDYGCGCGHFLQAVRNEYPEAVLTGLDYAESAILKAQQLRIGAAWSWWDITKPLFKPESFDFVTCIEVLEHVADYPAALANMMDSLRVGGKLLVTVPNDDGMACHVNHWTPNTLAAVLLKYGSLRLQLFHDDYNIIATVTKR